MSKTRFELSSVLWFRRSTNEWVLELDGSINDTGLTIRFPQPGTLTPEEAVGLPTLQQSAGWLFHNPDTGVELAEDHPIESGEVPDAENVKEANVGALKEALLDAWKNNAEEEKQNRDLSEQLVQAEARATKLRALLSQHGIAVPDGL